MTYNTGNPENDRKLVENIDRTLRGEIPSHPVKDILEVLDPDHLSQLLASIALGNDDAVPELRGLVRDSVKGIVEYWDWHYREDV